MIHNAWTFVQGDSNALRKQADDLEKITQASVNAYKSKATISEDEIKELMNNETWITAKEAVEYGFATKTEIEDERGVIILRPPSVFRTGQLFHLTSRESVPLFRYLSSPDDAFQALW